jgi:oligoendopeptidase F
MATALHPMPLTADDVILRWAVEQALGFAAAHRGRISTYDADGLLGALEQLEALQDALAQAEAIAGRDADGDEWLAEVEALTLFFDREWEAVPARHADALLADPQLAAYAHFLRVARRMPADCPTEAEERQLADEAIARAVARILAGSRAWT